MSLVLPKRVTGCASSYEKSSRELLHETRTSSAKMRLNPNRLNFGTLVASPGSNGLFSVFRITGSRRIDYVKTSSHNSTLGAADRVSGFFDDDTSSSGERLFAQRFGRCRHLKRLV
jgi:hypothetical protein